jgi:hypothetical protein
MRLKRRQGRAPFAVVITDFVILSSMGVKFRRGKSDAPGTPLIMLTAYGHRVSAQDDTLPTWTTSWRNPRISQICATPWSGCCCGS